MCETLRIEKSQGLSELIEGLVPEDVGADTVFCFDFDRTLTNGLNLEVGTPIERRIRGGLRTLEGLGKLQEKKCNLWVVTARSDLKALLSSLDHSQSELKPFFHSNQADLEIVTYKDVKFQKHGKIISCGYNKELAIEYILQQQATNSLWFIDDYVINAFNVHSFFSKSNPKETKSIHSVFWDPFEEETNDQMHMSNPHKEEFNYSDHAQAACEAFGIVNEERIRRKQLYLAKVPAPVKKKAVPVKKLKIDNSFALLSSVMGKRGV